ncbi:nucleotide exchange factor GrpE [Loigolactobacillus zhaoyuanensis]|uniref:Protein GrpE n=1 Tax=Loigolactobacillus zhaoyuanensis TaxID=2486017 RepID=A0ABW8U9G4_9LACO|nr:nucleotide exchange factor GrpE [Loigolactobacillus zhaoyuanensis]
MAKKKQAAVDDTLAQNADFPSEKDLTADAQTSTAATSADAKAATTETAAENQVPDPQAEQIKALQTQVDATEDKYLRAEAEIQNMNTRFKKEREQLLKYEGQSLVKDILPVIDNLERALAVDVNDKNGEQLKKGVQMVYDHLERTLKEHQIVEITGTDETFDPTLHQAVQTVAVEGDQKPDTVVQVLQKGYKLKDRVIRPAMVVVAQ